MSVAAKKLDEAPSQPITLAKLIRTLGLKNVTLRDLIELINNPEGLGFVHNAANVLKVSEKQLRYWCNGGLPRHRELELAELFGSNRKEISLVLHILNRRLYGKDYLIPEKQP